MSKNGKITVKNTADEKELEETALTHPKYDVRIEAVKKIRTPEILNRIALTSEDWRVRMHAARNIKDSDVLTEIVEKDSNSDVRIEALKNPNLTNKKVLLKCFRNENYTASRKAALTNPHFKKSLLFEIARDRENNYCHSAYRGIFNCFIEKYGREKYFRYRTYHYEGRYIDEYYIHDVPFCEIEKIYLIHDEEVLDLIENNASFEEIFNRNYDDKLLELAELDEYDEHAYYRHIRDKSLLTDLIQQENYRANYIHDTALSITDEAALLYYLTSGFPKIRRDITNLHDNSVLEYLAFKRSNDDDELTDIILKIHDADILMNIALNHHSQQASFVAVMNMDNQYASDFLSLKDYDAVKEKIMHEDDFEKVFDELSKIPSLAIRSALVKCITDEKILERICFSEQRFGIRRCSVRNIKNIHRLLRIIRKSKYEFVIRDAVGNIDDEDILTGLAANSQNKYARDEAIRKIRDENVLANIAKSDADWDVRKSAICNPHLTSSAKLLDILEREEEKIVQIEILEKLCRGD